MTDIEFDALSPEQKSQEIHKRIEALTPEQSKTLLEYLEYIELNYPEWLAE